MDQPVPNVTAADVERVVRRDFPPADVAHVLSALEGYGKNSGHREVPRVRLAILKLAHGNRKKLDQAIATADRDYRDVLAYAEFPKYFSDISPSEKNDVRKKTAIDADWQRYRTWLERK
jgi:hypothetical protein